jgi:uncharacterized membrane protein (DUF373 family)
MGGASRQGLPESLKDPRHPLRRAVVQLLSLVEDVVYVGLGLLLTTAALTLLVSVGKTVVLAVWSRAFGTHVISILDQLLLILLVVELLYTVQVSFREHALVAEPFIVVALIAAIRRVLVLTASVPQLAETSEAVFHHAMMELAILTAMVIVLVGSLILLQRHSRRIVDHDG